MKKTLSIVLCAVMILSLLAGCGGSSGSGGSGKSAEVKTFKIHCDYVESHPVSQQLAQFCKMVEEKTNGSLIIKPYYAGQLGDYSTCFDEVAEGSLEMTFGMCSETYGAQVNITNFPYLAPTWEDALKVFAPDAYVPTFLKEFLAEHNITVLAMHCVGAGSLATNKEPKDFETWGTNKECLIRVPNAKIVYSVFQDMGYQTQGINWSELFTAVQTGVVDGFVGGHPPAVYEQFRDVVKYVYQINNFFEMAPVAINTDIYNSLTDTEKQALQEAANWVFEDSVSSGEAVENEYLQKLADYGITVVKPDPELLRSWAEKTREEVWPGLKDELGEDVYNGLIEWFDNNY